MASTVVVLCALLVIGSAAAERGRWVNVETDNGTYVSLLKTAADQFWLRPSCLISQATVSLRCGRRPELLLRLELWTRDGLRRARRALIDNGHCRSRASCRVLPFQAVRFGVRDQDGRWESAQTWTSSSDGGKSGGSPVPAHQRFLLKRNVTLNLTKSPTAANCTNTAHGLTPAERSQLESLFVELVSVPTVPGGLQQSTNVSFSEDNVRWAAKRAGLNLKNSTTLVDRHNLRELARNLLRMRPASHFIITRKFIPSLEKALIATSVSYYVNMRSLLAQERRPANSEIVYFLKTGPFKVNLPVVAPTPGRLQISVQVPPQVPLINDSQRITVKGNDSIDDIVQNLRRRLDETIDILQALKTSNKNLREKVRNLETSHKRMKNLRSSVQFIKKRLNISANAIRFPDLIPVDDCTEIKQQGLLAGVYLLTANNRPVHCKADGSLVALRRSNGNVSFDRDWKDYVEGFGDPRYGDYWIGLRNLALLTQEASRCVTLKMRAAEDPDQIRTARYSGFHVAGEDDKFRLSYSDFRGDVNDSLSLSKGQHFTTKDRDHDSFPSNCARLFNGGGWYRSCYGANLFGPLLYPLGRTPGTGTVRNSSRVEGMCWRGVTRKEKCQPLVSLEMAIGSPASNLKVVLSKIGDCSEYSDCRSLLSHFVVPSTGRYLISAGGGGGGFGHYGNNIMVTGGRGAVVRAEAVLQKGSRLGMVIGCGGRRIGTAGNGGNATWLVDQSRRVLLLVAGGGGGAARDVGGMHGRASEEATNAWYPACYKRPTAQLLLQRHFPNNGGGLGWMEVKHKLLSAEGTVVSTGGKATIHNAGGGGGGYRGGGQGAYTYNPGGGGASYCNGTIASKCKSEEGGNVYDHGWLLIQKYTCFGESDAGV